MNTIVPTVLTYGQLFQCNRSVAERVVAVAVAVDVDVAVTVAC